MVVHVPICNRSLRIDDFYPAAVTQNYFTRITQFFDAILFVCSVTGLLLSFNQADAVTRAQLD